MADHDFTEADAVRVADAFETFRGATTEQMRPAGLATIRVAAGRRRRWRGYRAAGIAVLVVLLPSAIGLGLAGVGSHRTGPAPTPAPSATASPSPTPTTAPRDVAACVDNELSISVIAGGVGLGTWRTLIGIMNVSPYPCNIHGYPDVVAGNQGGETVTGHAEPTGALVSPSYSADAVITLAAGEQAAAEISAGVTDTSGRTCPSYQWLRVTAPNADLPWEISSFNPSLNSFALICGSFSVSTMYPVAAFQYDPQAFIYPVASAPPAAAPCQASQLSAHQTYGRSIANQPLTIVAFYNVSSTGCYLFGYVGIDAANADGQTVPISTTHGANYERSDPGASRVIVPPGGAASFAIGSIAGGLQSTMLTRLTLTLPGGGRLQVAATIAVGRTDTTGPYPLSETALVAGTNGPNP
jgi:hypothetical protein